MKRKFKITMNWKIVFYADKVDDSGFGYYWVVRRTKAKGKIKAMNETFPMLKEHVKKIEKRG